jgi:hypothetical protein
MKVRCTSYNPKTFGCQYCICKDWHEDGGLCDCQDNSDYCCHDLLENDIDCGNLSCSNCDLGVCPVVEKLDLRYFVEKALEE